MAFLPLAPLLLCAACQQQAPDVDDGPFFDRREVLAADAPAAVALADLNGDGHVDAVVSAGRLHVLLGDGTGALEPAGSVEAGEHPVGLAIADVNGDGSPDVALANHETDYVSVFLGDGTGALTPAPGSPITVAVEPHPHAVVLADMDGDGAQDLLVDHRAAEGVLVLRGRGDGSFEGPGRLVPTGGDPYRGMVAADVNGDGRLDLLTPNPNDVGVRLASDAAPLAFEEAPSVPAPTPFAIAVADLTGDGALDIVAASENDSWVRLFPGDGAGGFRAAADSVAIARSEGLAVATGDVNGDGVADAVVTSYTSPTVVMLLGGDAAGRATLEATRNPWGLAAADLNGDGVDDPVVADQGAGRVYAFVSRPR